MTPVGIRQFHQTSWLTSGPKPFHDTKLFDSSLGSSTPCIVKNYVIFNTEPAETTICWYRFLLSESRGSRSYRHPWYIKLKCFIRIWGKLSTQNNYLQKLQPTPLIFHFYCLFIYLSCSPCIKFKSVIPFFGLVPFPPSRISLFFKFIYIILDITLQFETIFAAQNVSIEQSIQEKTLTISRIPFQTNVVAGQ